jgi:hypothetical protein
MPIRSEAMRANPLSSRACILSTSIVVGFDLPKENHAHSPARSPYSRTHAVGKRFQNVPISLFTASSLLS